MGRVSDLLNHVQITADSSSEVISVPNDARDYEYAFTVRNISKEIMRHITITVTSKRSPQSITQGFKVLKHGLEYDIPQLEPYKNHWAGGRNKA